MRHAISISIILLICSGCNKEQDNQPLSAKAYFPMKTGNYWVYEHYNISEQGNEEKTGIIDSIYISGDTLVNDNSYFILEGSNYPYSLDQNEIIDLIRDSSGYLVNLEGDILFSPNNFSDILNSNFQTFDSDTIFSVNYQMEEVNGLISVPAGEFEVLNFKGTARIAVPGSNAPLLRTLNNYYARNTGRILESYYYVNSSIVREKRLIRFNVN